MRWRIAVRRLGGDLARDDSPVSERSSAGGWAVAVLAIFMLSIAVVVLRPKVIAQGTLTVPEVTASTGPVLSETRGNILGDPSFEIESSTRGVADNWVRIDQVSEYTLDARAKHGARSQRITKIGAADPITAYSGIQQVVTGIVGGHTYVVAVDYLYSFESAPDPTRSVGTVLYSLDKSGGFIADGTAVDWGWTPTADWVRKSLTFRAPDQATTLIVQFRISVNGSFWIDGASLEEINR
jgi:hypothetical protein